MSECQVFQSPSQPIRQLVNQPVNELINQSFSQSVGQPVNESINQSFSQSGSQYSSPCGNFSGTSSRKQTKQTSLYSSFCRNSHGHKKRGRVLKLVAAVCRRTVGDLFLAFTPRAFHNSA